MILLLLLGIILAFIGLPVLFHVNGKTGIALIVGGAALMIFPLTAFIGGFWGYLFLLLGCLFLLLSIDSYPNYKSSISKNPEYLTDEEKKQRQRSINFFGAWGILGVVCWILGFVILTEAYAV